MARGKYEYWLTPEGLLKIEGWARDGLTDEQIALNIGISRSTLNTWKDRYSDISDTLKRGKDIVDRQVESALLRRALGYEYEEVKKKFEGDVLIEKTVTKKEVIPDTTAQIFWLKNRKPDKWRDKPICADTDFEDDENIESFLKAMHPTEEDLQELFAEQEEGDAEEAEETREVYDFSFFRAAATADALVASRSIIRRERFCYCRRSHPVG